MLTCVADSSKLRFGLFSAREIYFGIFSWYEADPKIVEEVEYENQSSFKPF